MLALYALGTVVHEATPAPSEALLADAAWAGFSRRHAYCEVAVDEPRTGLSHDVHRLYTGFLLVLGVVEVPSAVGFNTRSDGDVLCHALIDALAGAIADGDLGTHFPEEGPDAEDARSLEFVRQFAGHVRRAGYEVVNVDSSVVLGPVKLRPQIGQVRANLADALGLGLGQVSVKARSNDGSAPRGSCDKAIELQLGAPLEMGYVVVTSAAERQEGVLLRVA